MDYSIHLDTFEGPFDLLLYLLKKDDLNIYDIPISQITAEYLQYMELMELLNINLAGDFLVMAVNLMEIKVKMLLPSLTDEEEEDPRTELVNRLLEYKKFKEVSCVFGEKENRQREFFNRPAVDLPDEEFTLDVSLFDLIGAFQKVLIQLEEAKIQEIQGEEFSVEERIKQIMEELTHRGSLDFYELFGTEDSRLFLIVTFIALLELIRLKLVAARQNRIFGEIHLYRLAASEEGLN